MGLLWPEVGCWLTLIGSHLRRTVPGVQWCCLPSFSSLFPAVIYSQHTLLDVRIVWKALFIWVRQITYLQSLE